jgi:Caspase domain
MRGVRLVLLLLAGLALVACATSRDASISTTPGPRAERPTYSVGEKWIRSDGVYELIRIEDGRYIFAAGVDLQMHLTQDLALMRVQRGPYIREWTPFYKMVDWPLEVGKWGVTRAKVWNPGLFGMPGEVEFTWRVEAYEDVQVAAGTFKAFRISVISAQPGWSGRRVFWYAPEARQFVKWQGFFADRFPNWEVVALDRPAPAPLQVALEQPMDQARVASERIVVAGKVSGGKGVARVLATLNGMEVARLEEPTPQRALAVNLSLTLREGENIMVITAAEADGMIHQEVRTVHYEKRLPLTVDFRYPEDRLRVTDEASVVAAVVTSSKGVAKVSVTLNGAEVFQQSERTPQRSMAVAETLKLREGMNVIVLSASEPDGTLRQELRTVIYERPKVAEAAPVEPPPPVPPPVEPGRWAVVIGVGNYENPEIPRLRYAVPDAEAMYQILIGPAGFKKEHVLLLTDKTEKRPTLQNIKKALGTFLARSARKGDTVFIFFAGHGAPEVDPRGIESDGLAKYLIPMDADPDDLFSTALAMDDIHTIFARIESERVVVFLDTCYSGAAGGRTFASKKTRAGDVDELFLERLTRARGRAIITASRPTEVSIELAELGHGLFTYYLVQGFKGSADLNRDGIVSLQELYEYVEQQVTQKSRAVGAISTRS